MWYYTYIIRSTRTGRLYTGFSNNLRKRFNEHNQNKNKSTKGRGPFEVVYYEACNDLEDAHARELYLKSGVGKHYIKNRLKCFLPARQSQGRHLLKHD
ncbi:GIY-YIG nuclease family protein [Patescibacteria group bacterium]|nr:GIY-YIG nuclease family protein [Patescibacteria group bacterium]MBU4057826.1 GIY-YIG nuclease family protein [Patescibacteria group bacterium]MBU4115978.1 GIY-YIG nuclease family protein [Patescibacteria group bacterium]